MAGEMGKLKPLNIYVHIHYSALFPTCWFVMIMTSLKSVALTDFLLQTLELMKRRNGVKATKGGEFLFLCITKLHTLKDTNNFYQ